MPTPDRPGDQPASSDDADDARRRARREWIAQHHPDRGGDPKAFAAGLARFADRSDTSGPRPAPGVRTSVHLSRSPVRRLRLAVRRLRRRARGQTQRNLR